MFMETETSKHMRKADRTLLKLSSHLMACRLIFADSTSRDWLESLSKKCRELQCLLDIARRSCANEDFRL